MIIEVCSFAEEKGVPTTISLHSCLVDIMMADLTMAELGDVLNLAEKNSLKKIMSIEESFESIEDISEITTEETYRAIMITWLKKKGIIK